MADVSVMHLCDMLNYDPASGVLTWRNKIGRKVRAGTVAGHKDRSGYVRLCFDGKRYQAHRLAWLLFHGSWPNAEIDHIDGDRSNNRIVNLRSVSNMMNTQNQRHAHTNNKLGILGVRKHREKFQSAIRLGGRLFHLGSFANPEAAHEAYVVAKRKYHEGCTL